MANSNAFLQSLVKDTQTICTEKFNLAKTALGSNNADIIALKKEMDRIFTALNKPDFWTNTVDADSEPIVEQIIELGSVDSSHLDGVVGKIQKMLRLLETNILNPGLESVDADPATSGMNLQVLDALRLTRQQIGIRLRSFAQAGLDLMQDTEFQTLQARQDPLVVTYREKLKADLIVSKQTDVIIIKRLGDLISATETTDAFKTNYSKLSDFIQTKLPQP